jgi:hypothetical protein
MNFMGSQRQDMSMAHACKCTRGGEHRRSWGRHEGGGIGAIGGLGRVGWFGRTKGVATAPLVVHSADGRLLRRRPTWEGCGFAA